MWQKLASCFSEQTRHYTRRWRHTCSVWTGEDAGAPLLGLGDVLVPLHRWCCCSGGTTGLLWQACLLLRFKEESRISSMVIGLLMTLVWTHVILIIELPWVPCSLATSFCPVWWNTTTLCAPFDFGMTIRADSVSAEHGMFVCLRL